MLHGQPGIPGRDIPEGLFLGELMTLDLESPEAIV